MTTISFKKLKDFAPCADGVDKLLNHLTTESGTDLHILTILDEMGANYTLWALCVANSNAETIASRIAFEFSNAALNIADEYSPFICPIATARDFINGRITLADLNAAHFKLTAYAARIHNILTPISGIESNPYRNALAAANAYGEILAAMAEYEPREIEARKVRVIRETLTDKKLLI